MYQISKLWWLWCLSGLFRHFSPNCWFSYSSSTSCDSSRWYFRWEFESCWKKYFNEVLYDSIFSFINFFDNDVHYWKITTELAEKKIDIFQYTDIYRQENLLNVMSRQYLLPLCRHLLFWISLLLFETIKHTKKLRNYEDISGVNFDQQILLCG